MSVGGPTSERKRTIELALHDLLESAEFKQSEQSKKLLRYLVEISQDETGAEHLRERVIGRAVFGLETGYDTTENPIVRVRANELRKRLAKYYQRVGIAAGPVQFEIPAGGYRVEFRSAENAVSGPPAIAPVPALPPAPVKASPAPSKHAAWRWGWVVVAGLVLTGLGLAVSWQLERRTPLENFWGPALTGPKAVMLCSGHPVVYRFSQSMQEQIRGRKVDHFEGQTLSFQLRPDEVVHGRDVVAVPDQYIGLGSATAVARIHGWLLRHKKESEIRFGNDLTFTDLRNTPAVLIGAYQNRWAVEFMRGLRFQFATANGHPVIEDTQTGKSWGLPKLQENGQTNEDYVLISRVLKSPTGDFMIGAAGITQYGGNTVGEVLTRDASFEAMMKSASLHWTTKNVQILMRVDVRGQTTGPPELVALHEW